MIQKKIILSFLLATSFLSICNGIKPIKKRTLEISDSDVKNVSADYSILASKLLSAYNHNSSKLNKELKIFFESDENYNPEKLFNHLDTSGRIALTKAKNNFLFQVVLRAEIDKIIE